MGRRPPDKRSDPLAASASESVSEGRRALEEGEWTRAREYFARACELDGGPEAWEGLGAAAWWLDDAETVFDTRQRAYRLYCDREDRLGAARVATWLAWDFNAFRGDRAVANGWLRRARSLLDGIEPSVEHGWLAVREASLVLGRDAARARDLSAEGVKLGRSLRSIDLEMNSLALEGLALVSLGAIDSGMARLDEATTAALAGEMRDPIAISFACCYLIFACERVRDFDRAGQWCERVSELSDGWSFRPMFAVCRAHYGTVLTWRGSWREAESELSSAATELDSTRPALAADGVARLGELRRRQGRLEEAAGLFERAEPHPLAALGEGAVALDAGGAERASDCARRFLRMLPEERRTERAPGLELLVRSEIALGHHGEAEVALRELRSIADATGTEAMEAAASQADGIVARAAGDFDRARQALEDTALLFERSGAPFETGMARLELAAVLAKLERLPDAAREARLALDSLEPLGARREADRARAVLEHAGSPGEPRSRRRPGELTPREVEVLRLVADGLSNREIADRLVLSEHTVHRHVANILAKLAVSSRTAAVARAAERGVL